MIQWFFLSQPIQHTITTYITALCQLIIKGCDRVIQLFGHDPAVRDVPLTQVYLQQLYSQSLEFQCAVTDFVRDLNIHYLLINFFKTSPLLTSAWGKNSAPLLFPKLKPSVLMVQEKQGKLLSPGKKGMSGNIFFLEGTLPPNGRKFQGLFLPSSIGPKSLLT